MRTDPSSDPFAFVAEVKRHFPGAVMSRLLVPLSSQRNRAIAIRAIERAPEGYTVDIREAKRSDAQNRALWGLLHQVRQQRPRHNGVTMTEELWKCVFLQALGTEMVMLPTLDGDGYFPLGHRSSNLTKSQFSALLELMLAWTAREGLTIKHFDGGRESAVANNAAPVAP